MFREDLQIKTLTCQNWRELIKVSSDESELNFLDKYMLLTYEDLTIVKQMRLRNKNSTIRNMFIAIWRTLDPTPKQRICSYLSKINGDGPTLLWYILTLYHGNAAQIICTQRRKIEKFNSVVDSYYGDIKKVCERMQNTVHSLVAAGGTNKQVFDCMYEAFNETRVLKFNHEIQVWKSVAEPSFNPKNRTLPLLSCRNLVSYIRSTGKTVNGLPCQRPLEAIITEKDRNQKS